MSTLRVAGWQKGKQRQEWQSCGPIGQSPLSRSSWPARKQQVVILELCTLASDPPQRFPVTKWTSSGSNYPHCLGCLLPLSQKTLGPPHPQRGECWRRRERRRGEKLASSLFGWSRGDQPPEWIGGQLGPCAHDGQVLVKTSLQKGTFSSCLKNFSPK